MVIIKEESYGIIESNLKNDLLQYHKYITNNYLTIAHLFSFYNKKIRAYITEAISKDIFEFRIHAYESSSNHFFANNGLL
jgi:hypothetical protein